MRDPDVAMQFDDADQQHYAATLGMWGFLAQEIMFFGGLFTAYTVYRTRFSESFHEASGHLYASIGIINTVVLLLSSFCMVMAVHAGRERNRIRLRIWLGWTILLGLLFLGIKTYEYVLDYHEQLIPGLRFDESLFSAPGEARMFFILYFIMTGLHAIHMIAGIGVLICLWLGTADRHDRMPRSNTVEMTGLYWHFVDMVWVFILPLLYLMS